MQRENLVEEFASKIIAAVLSGNGDEAIDKFLASSLPVPFKMQVVTAAFVALSAMTGQSAKPVLDRLEKLKAGELDEQ